MNSLRRSTNRAAKQKVMPDDHSKLAPLLPIPNRTVKRLSADDSADYLCESRTSSSFYTKNPHSDEWGFLFSGKSKGRHKKRMK